jgi:hypothetical protein
MPIPGTRHPVYLVGALKRARTRGGDPELICPNDEVLKPPGVAVNPSISTRPRRVPRGRRKVLESIANIGMRGKARGRTRPRKAELGLVSICVATAKPCQRHGGHVTRMRDELRGSSDVEMGVDGGVV